MRLELEAVDGKIQIRDVDTDNHDIVAIVPLAGDEIDGDYDKDFAVPFAKLICQIPAFLAMSRGKDAVIRIPKECEKW